MRVIYHPEFSPDIQRFEKAYLQISDGLAARFRDEVLQLHLHGMAFGQQTQAFVFPARSVPKNILALITSVQNACPAVA